LFLPARNSLAAYAAWAITAASSAPKQTITGDMHHLHGDYRSLPASLSARTMSTP